MLRKNLLAGATAIAATALLAATAAPASAADTEATFTLTGGAFTLSVATAAPLTGEATAVGANSITGSLGASSVTDARGGIADWTVSVVSEAFTGTGLSTSDDVQYTAGVVGGTGDRTINAAGAGTNVDSIVPVVSATEVSGNNSATWTPSIEVFMPAGALAGEYAGTVTTSLA